MAVRTDLALESLQNGAFGALEGVRSRERTRRGYAITEVEILDERGAAALGKPRGRYVTLDCGRLTPERFAPCAEALADELRAFLPRDGDAPVLVAGLGNRAMTPDALGPLTLERLVVTRHLAAHAPDVFGGLRQVAALEPGVLGATGIEAAELVRGAVERVEPAAVVAVDALAAAAVERLCATVQIGSSGIVPGSGVANARAALDERTLGVPVVAVGVPTVVEYEDAMFVTPREIDRLVRDLAKLVGVALSSALLDLSVEEVLEWLG